MEEKDRRKNKFMQMFSFVLVPLIGLLSYAFLMQLTHSNGIGTYIISLGLPIFLGITFSLLSDDKRIPIKITLFLTGVLLLFGVSGFYQLATIKMLGLFIGGFLVGAKSFKKLLGEVESKNIN